VEAVELEDYIARMYRASDAKKERETRSGSAPQDR